MRGLALLATILVLAACKSIPAGRTSVNAIEIRGASKLGEGDIEDKLATAATPKLLSLFRGILFEYSLFDESVLQRDLARVEAFYRSKGYYDVHARAGRVHVIDQKHVRIEIVVEEGDAVMVRDVHVEGLEGLPPDVADAVRKAATEGLRTNHPFEEETFEKTEGLARRALTDRGYAYATVTSDAGVDIVDHVTDIRFAVDPGPRCVFGETTIEGLGPIPQTPIKRAIGLTPGDRYSEHLVERAQQALLDLGVFASVELVSDTPAASGSARPTIIPIHVKVEPSRLRTIRLGGGFEFDALKAAVHGLIGWEHQNFFGGLRSFNVAFRPGVVLYPTRVNNLEAPTDLLLEERLRVEFKQPGFPEARTNLLLHPSFNVYPVLINPDPPQGAPVIGYAELSSGIGLERTFWKLYVRLSHNTQIAYPFAYVGNEDPTLGLVVISYPELYTALDFRDDKIHPRKGILLANTLQVAGGVFSGDANDVKVQPAVHGYVPVSRTIVWASRASVGFLWADNYGSFVQSGPHGPQASTFEHTRDYQLTFFRGFFSGGPTSNRGYPIRGVSPYDVVPFVTPDVARVNFNANCGAQCRTPTGGFTLWEASTELRINLSGPLSVATFCDASDVSPRPNDIRLDHLHLSCGGGVRYDTPAGPIRFDLGWRIPGAQVLGGLTPDEQEPVTFIGGLPIAVHIGIGEAY